MSEEDIKSLKEFNEVEDPTKALDTPLQQLLASFGITINSDE